MSRHLPAISGRKLVRALERAGFVKLRQKAVTFRWKNAALTDTGRTIVPLHREIRPGTLSDILNQTGLTKEQLGELL